MYKSRSLANEKFAGNYGVENDEDTDGKSGGAKYDAVAVMALRKAGAIPMLKQI